MGLFLQPSTKKEMSRKDEQGQGTVPGLAHLYLPSGWQKTIALSMISVAEDDEHRANTLVMPSWMRYRATSGFRFRSHRCHGNAVVAVMSTANGGFCEGCLRRRARSAILASLPPMGMLSITRTYVVPSLFVMRSQGVTSSMCSAVHVGTGSSALQQASFIGG